MKSITLLVAVFLTALVCANLTSCKDEESPDPIIGTWKSADRLECNGYGSYNDYNEMEIDENLEGKLTLYFAYEYGYSWDCVTSEFDVTVENKGGGDYDIELDCDEENAMALNCSDLDFDMECELDGDDLECDGESPFSTYVFEFERD